MSKPYPPKSRRRKNPTPEEEERFNRAEILRIKRQMVFSGIAQILGQNGPYCDDSTFEAAIHLMELAGKYHRESKELLTHDAH